MEDNELRDDLTYKVYNKGSGIYQIGAQINLSQPLHSGNVHMLKGVFSSKEEAQERLDGLCAKDEILTEKSESIKVEGHHGTWYVVAVHKVEGRQLFQVEHETYGDNAANLILDSRGKIVLDDVWNGIDDYIEQLEN